MASLEWKTKTISVKSLHLDPRNPRLDASTRGASPRDLIHFLFINDKAIDVVESITLRGFFPNEPLLAIREDNKFIVVEGNRRLAALKAIHEPSLLDGLSGIKKQVERLAGRFESLNSIAKVPVIIAPDRRSTDRQIAGKHIGTPVLAWQSENRATFILEKIAEGYENSDLLDLLGFSAADIQAARQIKAIADISRTLDLTDEIAAKLNQPRTKIFTTLERIFESTVGRGYLHVEPDPTHGFRGVTSTVEFLKGFKKLVTDIATGRESSRTLNSNDDIKRYFETWNMEDRPSKKKNVFIPSDLANGTIASVAPNPPINRVKNKKQVSIHASVIPKSLKVNFGNERLVDIRTELTRLKRADFPNAGAVLFRVFFELAVMHYLDRTGDLSRITQELKEKNKLQFDTPQMKQLIPEITRIAKTKLHRTLASKVEKAIKYDSAAPFTLSDLHAFVHQNSELPSERDILQFWLRTEPLFRLMLEKDITIEDT